MVIDFLCKAPPSNSKAADNHSEMPQHRKHETKYVADDDCKVSAPIVIVCFVDNVLPDQSKGISLIITISEFRRSTSSWLCSSGMHLGFTIGIDILFGKRCSNRRAQFRHLISPLWDHLRGWMSIGDEWSFIYINTSNMFANGICRWSIFFSHPCNIHATHSRRNAG